MRMWSRGLGRSNIGIVFEGDAATVMTVKDAMTTMPDDAQKLLIKEIHTGRVIAVSGKMLPPTGWEYVIVFELKDLVTLTLKFLRPKLWNLFFGSVNRFKKEIPED